MLIMRFLFDASARRSNAIARHPTNAIFSRAPGVYAQ